ncbi:MAG TPA: glycosyltransferase, partial [Thermomicrobiales bacterium]|nr:glycosyltransferase [Thermomicrobiales bacterium]
MSQRPRVDAVIVSYNVRALLLECIASLVAARKAGEVNRIVIVDNASSDGSAAAAQAADPRVEVVEAANRG